MTAPTTTSSSIAPKPPDILDHSSTPETSTKGIFSILNGNPTQEAPQLKPKSIYKGEPTVFFSRSDIYQLEKPFKFSLIGKFSQRRPSIETIRKVFTTLNLKVNFHIGVIDDKHILIRLNCEDDYHHIWLKENWRIFNYPMKVLKWSLISKALAFPYGFHYPIYHHHFAKTSLFSIAQIVGKPIRIDSATASLIRPSVARVCVEADVSSSLPKRVWIGCENTGHWQQIEYENVPSYCSQCLRLGHDIKHCVSNTKPTNHDPKIQINEPITQTKELDTNKNVNGRKEKVWRQKSVDTTSTKEVIKGSEIVQATAELEPTINILNEKDERAKVVESDTSARECILNNAKTLPTTEGFEVETDINEALSEDNESNDEIIEFPTTPPKEIKGGNFIFNREYNEFLLHRIVDPLCTLEDWKKMHNDGFQEVTSKKNKKKTKFHEKQNTIAQREEPHKQTIRKPSRLMD